MNNLAELPSGVGGCSNARAQLAECFRVEERDEEQQPVSRLGRLPVCRQVQPQRKHGFGFDAGRGGEGYAPANHLRVGGQVREAGFLQFGDEPGYGWVNHGMCGESAPTAYPVNAEGRAS